MSTTAADVFDIAMGLIDEVHPAPSTETSGTSDTEEYRLRTPQILTALQGELYFFSDTYSCQSAEKRPVCTPVSSMTDTLDLDDFLARSVLPYGLSAHLLLDENPSDASFFQQRYSEMLLQYAGRTPREAVPIEDVYGVASPAESW